MKSSERILFDARWIPIDGRFDGVGRYSYEIAVALSKQRSNVKISWLVYDERQLDNLPKSDYVLANNPNNVFKEMIFLPKKINRLGYKIVYSPFFIMGTLGKKYKLVMTIHDLIYMHFPTPPQWLPWYTRLGWRVFYSSKWPLKLQLNRADTIATVSETAAEDIRSNNITNKKIVCVPNAVSDNFLNNDKASHYSSNSIVYMGSFTPYKNVECLISAVKFLPGITLHLCSKIPPARRESLEKFIKEAGVRKQIIMHNGVSDEQYLSLLKDARCSISASKIEGFGLPILEAQLCGIPFVCADTPIFHEVGGDSVLYFNPKSPRQAADCIELLGKKESNNKFIKLGYKNARRYSWDRSAKLILKTIGELAK